MKYTTKSLFLAKLETDTEIVENTRLLTFTQIANQFNLQWSNGIKNIVEPFNEVKVLYDAIVNNKFFIVENNYHWFNNSIEIKIEKGIYTFEYKGELDNDGEPLTDNICYSPLFKYEPASTFVNYSEKEITSFSTRNSIAERFIRRAALNKMNKEK